MTTKGRNMESFDKRNLDFPQDLECSLRELQLDMEAAFVWIFVAFIFILVLTAAVIVLLT